LVAAGRLAALAPCGRQARVRTPANHAPDLPRLAAEEDQG